MTGVITITKNQDIFYVIKYKIAKYNDNNGTRLQQSFNDCQMKVYGAQGRILINTVGSSKKHNTSQ